jgi:hypothetical protein
MRDNTIDQLNEWADDLEIEALPAVRNATLIPALVFLPPWIHGPLTTVIAPQYGAVVQPGL